VRVRGSRVGVGQRPGLGALGLGPRRPRGDLLKCLDPLRHAVFEDFEFVLLQVRDDLAVQARVDVHADEVHAGPEDRLLLVLGRGRLRGGLRLCADRDRDRNGDGERRRDSVE
jgi:hypothetical protein